MSGMRATLLAPLLLGAGCGDSTGPEATAAQLVVGVVPYATPSRFCEQGSNRESVYFRMDDENSSHCSYETGDFEAGHWVSPQAVKVPLPEECASLRTHTLLPFCRTSVPVGAFRPLTTDPENRAQAYAVLRFGNSCPEHSVEITKRSSTRTSKTRTIRRCGRVALSQRDVDDARGNYTKLYFCLFRFADRAEDTMAEFPDLGFPYAVFHDFDGDQPGWVIRKRWQHSDDSNQIRMANQYVPPPDTNEDSAELLRMIENPEREGASDTYFEMARVR